jgi:eukaryotic-like serine/threonine-protein kinase
MSEDAGSNVGQDREKQTPKRTPRLRYPEHPCRWAGPMPRRAIHFRATPPTQADLTDATARLTAALQDRYAIERELGAGGMATVYLAHDLRHDRKVALKVLRPELASILGAERFLAEIKTTANLQHPHILALFDSGEAGGLVFYVMPYVEGESLRDRLTREKQLPVEEAVRIAREAADALEYAHQQGVVHRDIKPENILLRGGHAMVADFGIALAASRSDGGTRMTETGMSLGTPHYMSPEQAMGEKEITPAADVYALGCVLYEMLTGEPPFTGPTAQAVVAKLLTSEPEPVATLRRTVPPHVEAALETALQKLPADRFASAAQFGEALGRPDYTVPFTRATTLGRGVTRWHRFLPLVAMGTIGAAAGIIGAWLVRVRPAATPLLRFYVTGDTSRTVTGDFALSPDGTTLVYLARTASGSMLFKQRLSDLDPSPIPGTADAASDFGGVFFAPDGATIGFSTGVSIKRVRLDGSEPRTVTTFAGLFAGATWSTDGFIVYAVYPDTALMRVSDQGGNPTPIWVRSASGPILPLSPRLLPGGQTLLCTNLHTGTREEAQIGVVTIASGMFKPVAWGVSPTYVAPSTLVYGRLDGSVMAQPFDAGRGDTTGPASLLAQNVTPFVGVMLAYDVSRTGVLAYLPERAGGATLRLVHRDGTGRILSRGDRFWGPRFSPDGRRIAYGAYAAERPLADLWSFDLAANTDQRLTSGGQATRDYNDATWSPNGKWMALSGIDTVGRSDKNLYLMPSDASSPPVRLLDRPGAQWPTDWTRDGKAVLFTDVPPGAPKSIWLVPTSGVRAPVPIVKTIYDALGGRISPDGRWLAYESDETGQSEVYVQRFPGPGPRVRVSASGGQMPVWSRSGREVYYWFRDQLMVAVLELGSEATVVERRPLFKASFPSGSRLAQYDVAPDDESIVYSAAPGANDRLAVVSDLQTGLAR